MASHLETEIVKLKNIIIKIGGLAENQVSEAIKALLSEPGSESKEVRKTEIKIDKLDDKIEDICQGVFALQQPVASDLRFIMSAMQISSQIERIGDLSINIIKLNKSIKEKHELIIKHNILDITKDVEEIVAKTNACFETLDEKLIEEIFAINNIIKNKSSDTIDSIINQMKTQSKTVVSGTNLVIALKHFERVSDHCTNIVESVYFMIHAKTIKHERLIEKR